VVQQLYPESYTRLYTSGAFFDAATAEALAQAGLDEIRFSVKTEDSKADLDETFERIRLARATLPFVVVEMPVMPDELEVMQQLLVRLDQANIDGINLLELGFPFNNAEEFAKRGYKLKPKLFRTLYNYTYAAGLPIAGSEEACLKLLGFALDRELKLGVHYCSLENKYSSQVYLQNIGYKDAFKSCDFSKRDYFLKSAKAFGIDANRIERFLSKRGLKDFRREDNSLVEFSPTYINRLRKDFPNIQLGLSYYIVEGEGRNVSLRELRLDLTTPKTFDLSLDL